MKLLFIQYKLSFIQMKLPGKPLAVSILVICAQILLSQSAYAVAEKAERITLGDITIYVEQHGLQHTQHTPIIFFTRRFGQRKVLGESG